MSSALTHENPELHRQIYKLSKQNLGGGSGAVARPLRSIECQIGGSLERAALGDPASSCLKGVLVVGPLHTSGA